MKVSGFTFLRNAELHGYPFTESICSILPIVDEFICVVGESVDETKQRVMDIGDPKIKIIETTWNDNMCDRGYVYGQQKMIGHFACTGDWAFYLEGDEVVHEEQLETIHYSMVKHLDNPRIEALHFDFIHFYGTPQMHGIAGYRKAPRIIRNSLRAIAPDGLFWVILDKNKKGRYPRSASSNANIYHYGHCRDVRKMAEKLKRVGHYWGEKHSDFCGYGYIDTAELREFHGTHPGVITNWLENEAEHVFEQASNYKLTRRDLRNRFRFWLEDKLNIEISKKHFFTVR